MHLVNWNNISDAFTDLKGTLKYLSYGYLTWHKGKRLLLRCDTYCTPCAMKVNLLQSSKQNQTICNLQKREVTMHLCNRKQQCNLLLDGTGMTPADLISWRKHSALIPPITVYIYSAPLYCRLNITCIHFPFLFEDQWLQ